MIFNQKIIIKKVKVICNLNFKLIKDKIYNFIKDYNYNQDFYQHLIYNYYLHQIKDVYFIMKIIHLIIIGNIYIMIHLINN